MLLDILKEKGVPPEPLADYINAFRYAVTRPSLGTFCTESHEEFLRLRDVPVNDASRCICVLSRVAEYASSISNATFDGSVISVSSLLCGVISGGG